MDSIPKVAKKMTFGIESMTRRAEKQGIISSEDAQAALTKRVLISGPNSALAKTVRTAGFIATAHTAAKLLHQSAGISSLSVKLSSIFRCNRSTAKCQSRTVT
jgi:hypothetical protein